MTVHSPQGTRSADETLGDGETIQTNDIETYYVRRGDGPPIVFIHGTIMDHRMWAPQFEALGDEYTTIAYDLRGHGRTGGSAPEQYSVDLWVSDLDPLLTAVEIDRSILCGLSLGGGIAQAYAVAHPDKVAGLVLAETFGPGPLGLSGRLAFANLRFFAWLDRFVSYKRLNDFQLRVSKYLKPGMGGDGVTIQRLIDEGPTIPHDEFVKIIDALVAFPEGELDISRIDVPTLVLYGEHEASFIKRQSRRIAATIPHAALREIPEAGHASNLDNPVFFSNAVQEFAADSSLDPVR